ncbi:MAG: hypothetical protein C4523_11525 [Myxococcales bacterium]|nr:MAG: hypothetical protein C4523_11525 [Myxococcales bacterium]
MATAVVFAPLMAYAGFFDSVKKSVGVEDDEVVALESKDICPKLAEFAGGKYDPYKEKKLEYTKIHVDQVDDFTLRMTKLNGTMDFASNLTKETKAEIAAGGFDQAALTARLATLTEVLMGLVGEAQGLVSSGQTLVTSLPSVLAGPKVAKVESITNSVKQSIADATALPDKAKGLTDEVKQLGTQVVAGAAGAAQDAAAGAAKQAGEAAGQAADAAKAAADKAGEAAGQAADTAKAAADQAGEAAQKAGEAAKEAGETAKEAAKAAGK